MRLFWVLLLGMVMAVWLPARTLTYESIHKMPKSVEKDFYIWRYISDKKSTKSDAKKLILEAWRINAKLAKAYRLKTGGKAPKISGNQHVSRGSRGNSAEYKEKILKTKEILRSKDPFASWLDLAPDMKVFVFNHAGRSGRKALDKPISKSLFATLTTLYGFNDSIYRIKKDHLKHISQALLYLPAKGNKISYNNLVKLGFNALMKDKKRIAETYFTLAATKAQQREQLDKALFWAYMSQKRKKYLKSLGKSYDVNIYTLAARDILDLPYPNTITPSLPSKSPDDQNISDPIIWADLKKKIFSKKYNLYKLADNYKSSQDVGYYTYVMTKASKGKKQYFPMPYRDLLSKLPKSRQAMIYAIARQESRFVPACVSTSFAVGMMQFMPFLVRHIAKQRHEKVNYESMFEPRKSLIYANDHLDYLYKWLQHPLFVAYAYNAGIGYTRRLIRKPYMFNGKGSYEPYLSLETVDNDQARHYGKHVLTNYVIYMNKLGIPTRITDLLSSIHIPEKTDKFRKRTK